MSIYLRGIGTELQQALKVRAASEGVTLQSLCVRFLWWGLEAMNGQGVMAEGAGEAGCSPGSKRGPG